jgi:hypothetical protein
MELSGVFFFLFCFVLYIIYFFDEKAVKKKKFSPRYGKRICFFIQVSRDIMQAIKNNDFGNFSFRDFGISNEVVDVYNFKCEFLYYFFVHCKVRVIVSVV